MATRKPIYVNGVNGVAANATATVTVPTGKRYHSVDLFVTDSGVADFTKVTEIRLTVDGTLMQRYTPTELDKLYKLNLNTSIAGRLNIPFSEITRATVLQEEATSWPLFGRGKFEIAVDFGAATNPTLKVVVSQDETQLTETVNGVIVPLVHPVKILPYSFNPGAGWFDMTTLPNDAPITALYIQTTSTPTAGDILDFEVFRGSEKVAEGTYLTNSSYLAPFGYDATQFILPIIFDANHQIATALDCRVFDNAGKVIGLQPLTVRVNMASAKGIKVLVASVRSDFN